MKKKILKILLVVFIAIQAFRIDKTNPPVVASQDFIAMYKPSEAIANTLRNSCYDCHSNTSKYPWYSNVAPVSWLVKNHINEGREELNFSEWGTFTAKRKSKKLEDIVEEVEAGEMPMKPYVLMHSEAKMSSEQREALVNYFKELGK